MMAGQKRVSDSNNSGKGNQLQFKKQKTHALPSEILEVHSVDTQQKVETCLGRLESRIERLEACLGRIERLETCLARIVSQFERAVPKLVPAMDGGRQSLKQIEGPDGRNLQLPCLSKLPPYFFTEGKVGGGVHGGETIRVELIDKSTGNIVTSGSESRVKLDVVVLEGDFNHEDDDDDEWTWEDLENHVVHERVGKRPLLAGELKVPLQGGVGSLGEVTFTDNSSWIRCKKFRLGLGVRSGLCEGIRIREAKTNAFTVKEHRGQEYEKHHPPSWDDELWRLDKIRKDGSFHKKLDDNGIFTVEDFLRFLVRDSQALRKILGDGMPTKNGDALVKHAKTCCPFNGKQYVYYDDDLDNIGIIFNNTHQVNGLIAGGQYYSTETLSDSQKVFVDTLVKKAYADWMDIEEYDGRMQLNMKQNQKTSTSQTIAVTGGLADYPVSFDQPVYAPRLPSLIPSVQAIVNTWLPVGDYPVSFGQPVSMQRQPSSVSSQQAFVYPDLAVEDYAVSFHPQVSFQPSSVPSEQTLVNFGLAFGGGMGSDEELWWENFSFLPPFKYVLLLPFYARRFRKAVARNRAQLVELEN